MVRSSTREDVVVAEKVRALNPKTFSSQDPCDVHRVVFFGLLCVKVTSSILSEDDLIEVGQSTPHFLRSRYIETLQLPPT